MTTRRGVRRTLLAAGVVLLASLLLAPRLPPRLVVPLSVLWYAALVALLWAALQILPRWIGRRGALLLIGLLCVSPILLTALPAPPSLALRLPCRRNWLWLPSWLLRSSPLEALRFEVGGAAVKLCYGRPALRGRRMLGGPRVPYGRLWRTGANEPTTLITTAPLDLAGIRIPAGRVALYTIPGPETWELIVNTATTQWGIESEYSAAVAAHELGHAILGSERGEPVERLSCFVEPAAGAGANAVELVLAWDTARLPIPIRTVPR